MDSRANPIPAEYRRKAAAMDSVLGEEEGEGPCLRRLAELPLVLWGGKFWVSRTCHPAGGLPGAHPGPAG